MHLDHGEPGRENRVAERDAGVGQATRVQQDPVDSADRAIQCVDEHAFMGRLQRLERTAELLGEIVEPALQLPEWNAAIDVRFTGAQRVQVRAVQDQYVMHRFPGLTIAHPLRSARHARRAPESGAAR